MPANGITVAELIEFVEAKVDHINNLLPVTFREGRYGEWHGLRAIRNAAKDLLSVAKPTLAAMEARNAND